MSEREKMKAKRDLNNEIDKRIKGQAKSFGYKFRSPCAFAKQGEYFISSFCSVMTLEVAIVHIAVKKLIYDDIFWDVMNMSSNKDQPLSLRAVGAFTAPGIIVCRKEVPIFSDLDAFVESFYQTVIDESTRFLQENPLNDYILSHEVEPWGGTLKCLVHLSCNDISSAISEAKTAIASGDHDGGFVNEGKGFFDWILFQFDHQEDASSPPAFSQVYQNVPIESPQKKKDIIAVDTPREKTSFLERIKEIVSHKKTELKQRKDC